MAKLPEMMMGIDERYVLAPLPAMIVDGPGHVHRFL
jgi:hypothetical protein